ncbi:unnamed protein product [Clavelina lepadiformis]|uniref:THD domain-containing protein n=1 Tax=Clavelina lepadiformis TaxID=159417 RepID=A0ABP0GY48_CLALP
MVSAIITETKPKGYKIFRTSKDVTYTLYQRQKIWTFVMFLAALIALSWSVLYAFRMTNEMEEMRNKIEQNRKFIDEVIDENNEHESLIENLRQTLNANDSNAEILRNNRVRRSPSDYEVFTGAHVVGCRGSYLDPTRRYEQIPGPGGYFEWRSEDDLAIRPMLIKIEPENYIERLEIRTPGYYFVYSQVTYHGRGENEIGHETVLIRNSQHTILMSSVTMQVLADARNGHANQMRNLDSGYHGGVFYLGRGDKLAVRPANHIVGSQRFRMEGSKSFFGVALLHL